MRKKNLCVEIYFTHRTIRSFKVRDSLVFSAFTRLCRHRPPTPKHSVAPKEAPTPLAVAPKPRVSQPRTPAHPLPVWGRARSGLVMWREAHAVGHCVSGYSHAHGV